MTVLPTVGASSLTSKLLKDNTPNENTSISKTLPYIAKKNVFKQLHEVVLGKDIFHRIAMETLFTFTGHMIR